MLYLQVICLKLFIIINPDHPYRSSTTNWFYHCRKPYRLTRLFQILLSFDQAVLGRGKTSIVKPGTGLKLKIYIKQLIKCNNIPIMSYKIKISFNRLIIFCLNFRRSKLLIFSTLIEYAIILHIVYTAYSIWPIKLFRATGNYIKFCFTFNVLHFFNGIIHTITTVYSTNKFLYIRVGCITINMLFGLTNYILSSISSLVRTVLRFIT